jgi:hypothetical protein
MNNGKGRMVLGLAQVLCRYPTEEKPAEAIPFPFFPAAMIPVGPRKNGIVVEKKAPHSIHQLVVKNP